MMKMSKVLQAAVEEGDRGVEVACDEVAAGRGLRDGEVAELGHPRPGRGIGQHPFGAVLVDPSGAVVLESENRVPAENDCTAHAEL